MDGLVNKCVNEGMNRQMSRMNECMNEGRNEGRNKRRKEGRKERKKEGRNHRIATTTLIYPVLCNTQFDCVINYCSTKVVRPGITVASTSNEPPAAICCAGDVQPAGN